MDLIFAGLLSAQGFVAQHGLLIVAMLASGLFAGLVAGMFGIGGGFVVVPALVATFQALSPAGATSSDHIMHVAIGTSLATIVFTSLRAVQAHAKRGAVDFSILKGWSVWVVIGVLVGVALTGVMNGDALKIVFGVGVAIMGLHFLAPLLRAKPMIEERLPKGPVRAALGSGLGAASSLLGIGGGTPAVLIMTMSGVNMHRAVATAAGFGTLIAIPGAIGNLLIGLTANDLPFGSVGFVNIIALVSITAMSVITAPVGVALAHSLDARMLKRVFGVYLLFTAALMLHDSAPVRWLVSRIGA